MADQHASPPAEPAPDPAAGPPHMTPDEFRAIAHRAVDWIADYMRAVASMPVLARVEPGDVARSLPEHPPQDARGARAWDDIFRDLDRVIMPGITHWQSPRFFGYFPCNASGPGIVGELISAGLGVQGMLWQTSPACTELETRVLDWLAEIIGLPERFRSTAPGGGGVIQGTASDAALVTLVAARARVRARTGRPCAHPVVYASRHAHSSIAKAAVVAGVADGPDDRAHLRSIETDAAHAMRPDALARAVADDLAAGRDPIFVCATAGTTSSLAMDPIGAIASALERTGLGARGGWLHVDAAHAGAACVCPEHRGILAGVEHADSVCFNPHKWLLTNFDCDALWTSDRESLVRALCVTPEYLRNEASMSGRVLDYRDWQVPLGRRFRALKLWMVIRHYGVEGLRAHVRAHVGLASLFASLVEGDARLELVTPPALNLVCFRARAGDEATLEVMRRVNESGRAFITHTRLPVPAPDGPMRACLRVAIGSPATSEEDVRGLWALVRGALP